MARPDLYGDIAVAGSYDPSAGYVLAGASRSGLEDGLSLGAVAAAAEAVDRTPGVGGPVIPAVRHELARIIWPRWDRPCAVFSVPVQRVLGWRAYEYDSEAGKGATANLRRGEHGFWLPPSTDRRASELDALVVGGYGGLDDTGRQVTTTPDAAAADLTAAVQAALGDWTPVVGESLLLFASSGDGRWAWGVNLMATSWADGTIQIAADSAQWGDVVAGAEATMRLYTAAPPAELSNICRVIAKRWANSIAQPGSGAFPGQGEFGGPPSTPALTYQMSAAIKQFMTPLTPEVW